jgi:two-component system, cell cycle sensor histidine kinase and response regulator CckA
MKTILFINREESIREEATRILLEEGYDSLFARNYAEALDFIRDGKKRIVMVILDINLLVEGGIEIYDRIKEINPNLPVVTTSTAGHYRPRLGADCGSVKFSSKPCSGGL